MAGITPPSSVENLTFRAATEADYEGVMNINRDIYNGIDYLPAFYMQYTRDHTRHMYVAEIQGKVVAFAMQTVVDDGTRVTGQASRVHPDYQKKGVMASIASWAMQQTRARVPTLKASIWATGNSDVVVKGMKQDPSIVLETKRMVFVMGTSCTELASLLNGDVYRRACVEYKCDSSTLLTASQARDILKRGDIDTEKMVPEGVWITNHWEPYRPFASNYQTMVTGPVVVTREAATRHVTAISFSCPFPCRRGTMYNCHFYSEARGKESLPQVKCHLLKHLALLKKLGEKESFVLRLFVPQHVPVSDLRGFVYGELGLKWMVLDILTNSSQEVYCFSKDLDAQLVTAKV